MRLMMQAFTTWGFIDTAKGKWGILWPPFSKDYCADPVLEDLTLYVSSKGFVLQSWFFEGMLKGFQSIFVIRFNYWLSVIMRVSFLILAPENSHKLKFYTLKKRGIDNAHKYK